MTTSAWLHVTTTAVLLGPLVAVPAAQTLPPGNLGLATPTSDFLQNDQGRLAFSISEEAMGGMDLNGDGDADDILPHLRFMTPGVELTFPESGRLVLGPEPGPVVMLSLDEADAGDDLNGDGDADDSVWHSHDLRTGARINTGLNGSWQWVGDLFVVAQSEAHAGSDLNGDGDQMDRVVHVHDIRTGVTSNLGLAVGLAREVTTDGRFVTLLVSEFSQGGQDLDGDGGAFSAVAHVYDARTGAIRNSAAPAFLANQDSQWISAAGRLVLSTPERHFGVDLDGDGALTSTVVVFFDPATASLAPTSLVYPGFSPRHIVAAGRWVYLAYRPDNASLTDYFLVRCDIASGVDQGLGPSMGNVFSMGGTPLVSDGEFVAVVITETTVDLNGDGDVDDHVAHRVDPTTGQPVSLRLACITGGLRLAEGVLAIVVSEADQGGADRNGDGDAEDSVPTLIEMATGATHDVGLATVLFPSAPGFLTRRKLVHSYLESWQGNVDVNGDGDVEDFVVFAYDLGTATTTVFGVTESIPVSDGRSAAFRVDETLAGGVDLNGDGDTLDRVVHLVDL